MATVQIGNLTAGSSNVFFPPANNKAVCRFQNTSGAIVAIDKYVGNWTGVAAAAKVKAVIFSDSAGVPGTLLATSAEKVGITSGWNTLTFATPLNVAAGDWIWIGVISDTDMASANCLSTGTIKYVSDTYSDGVSPNFIAPNSVAYTYQAYVEGTTAADPVTHARLSQLAVEVLRINTGTKIRTSQLAVEVLRPNVAAAAVNTARPQIFVCT